MSTRLIYSLTAGVFIAAAAIFYWQVKLDVDPRQPDQQVERQALRVNRLKSLLSDDYSKDTYRELLEKVDDLVREKKQYKPHEIRWLVKLLSAQPKSYPSEQWHEMSNSLLNLIQVQSEPSVSSDVTSLLIGLAEKSNDSVMRLYGVQHYRAWYQHNASEADQSRLKDSLIVILQRQEAGTALKVLSDLGIGEVEVSERAVMIAADPEKDLGARITSMQLSCERNNTKILPLARRLATDSATHLQLRKAAVFSIGVFGDATDLPVLTKISSESSRLKAAAKLANNKIISRQ